MIFTLLSRSREWENPSVPLDVADDASPTSGNTDAGVWVSRRRILGHPAVWRCVNLISKSIARLPIHTYRYVDGGGKEHDEYHPAYWLLRRKPNRFETPYRFKLRIMADVLFGDSFVFIDRNQRGDASELIPLRYDRVTPVVFEGQPWYIITLPNGEQRRLDSSSVMHFAGLALNEDFGDTDDVITMLREAFALGIGQRKFRSIFFKNNGRPNVVLEHPNQLSDIARKNIMASWQKMVGGIDNAHKAALLEEGLKLHELKGTARESQLIEAEDHELVQIANIFGIPPHKVGAKTNTSYKSLEQENQAFLDEGLDPWLVMMEEEFWLKLLSGRQQTADSHVISFERRAMLRADMTARGAFYSSALQSGWMSRDEVRAAEDLNPIPDGKGKEFLQPANMLTVGDEPTETDPSDTDPPADPEDDPPTDPAPDDNDNDPEPTDEENARLRRGLERLLARDLSRIVGRVYQGAIREAKARPEKFVAWLDSIETEHARTAEEMLVPTLEALGEPTTRIGLSLMTMIRDRLLDESGEAKSRELPELLANREKAWRTEIEACVDPLGMIGFEKEERHAN